MSMEAGAGAIVLGSRRLDLRPLVMEDLDDLAELFADELAMRNQCRTGTQDDARAYIEHHLRFYDQNGFGQLTVIERETGHFVGKCGFSSHEIEGFREYILNYLIHPRFEEFEYDRESFAVVCEHAFDELDFMRVVTMIKPRNKRLIRVATETGFEKEKEKEVQWEGMKMHLYVRHNH